MKHVAKIGLMLLTDEVDIDDFDIPTYVIEYEDIEHLRLQLHKDIDNTVNAQKSVLFGTREPRIEIVEEGFSGRNGKT